MTVERALARPGPSTIDVVWRPRPSGARQDVGRRAAPQYVVDSSVWARLPRSGVVQDRLRRVIDDGDLVMATPVLLKVGHTARDPQAWDRMMTSYGAFPVMAPTGETHAIALEIQGALWHGGKVRAAGAFDILVAALAIEHGATVIHYDRDYEHIADVDARLRHEWVAPGGSL